VVKKGIKTFSSFNEIEFQAKPEKKERAEK